ncbi:hypothetical protein HETIRDRAFT_471860, partial [Heterobasidion irregulare TC 32-1]
MALCVRGEPSRRDQRRSLMSRCGLVHPELCSCSRPNFLFLEDRQNGIFIFI